MTDQERYLFDLQGYLLVQDALSPQAVAALNAVLDEQVARNPANKSVTTMRLGGLLHWGEANRALLDNPRISPILEELISPSFRLDHEYADIIRSGLGPIGATLHGGGTPFSFGEFFRFADGKMYNGLTVVAYNLHPVNPGDGGFACVPGSHKANYRLPADWAHLESPQPIVKTVPGPAGAAIIFTEALTHGTLPWNGAQERRTLFYKFSPGAISYSSAYYNAEDYEPLTARQRAILEAPNGRFKQRGRVRTEYGG